jgi:HD-like signal output (HDOD) protein
MYRSIHGNPWSITAPRSGAGFFPVVTYDVVRKGYVDAALSSIKVFCSPADRLLRVLQKGVIMGPTDQTIACDPGHRPDAVALAQQEKRKTRLTAIVSAGLPTLPSYVLELNSLLKDPAVNMKKVTEIIRSDPSLSGQLLRMCNSAMFGQRRKVLSISQAAVILGTERLRTMVLTCSVMRFAGRQLPSTAVQIFWQHSLSTALLSERIAGWMDYSEKEQAYLSGLLHDIGQLPLWMVAQEERARGGAAPPTGWQDNVVLEREHFGMDHCEIGRHLGVAWNFLPSFMDVFEHHHNPTEASHDSHLVGMVAAADHFCQTHALATGTAPQKQSADAADQQQDNGFLKTCLPRLFEEDRTALAEMLETEYPKLQSLIEYSMAS